MSEKRLSFIIDTAKAKTGAEKIKQSLKSIQSVADKLQRTLTSLDIVGMSGGSGGSTRGVDATARAMKNAANSAEFWEQRLKDLDSAQYKHLVQTRETARQVEAYQKSLVQALTPAQKLSKAENELSKQYQSSKVQAALYEKGLAQKNVKQRESVSLQKQLAQSQARLAQTYTKEYADLIRNNAAIQKRRREILGLDDAQKKISLSADRLRSAVLAIGGAFGAYSFGYIAAEAVRIADAYTGVQNRLAVVTGGTVDLTQATRELLNVSIESRTALDTTMDVYAKMIRVTKDMSFQNKDLLRITESVSKAVAMSGASAQGAEGALLQFSQALSGDFQASAQELNSIIEQTPAVAQLMADALNKVDPSINATLGNLKRLATEGRFSTEMLLEGILLMSDGIDEQFGRATRTVSQSLQALRDSVMVTFGEIDRAFGGSGSLAEGITDVAESLGGFKEEIAGAGAAVAAFIGVVGAFGLAALTVSLGTVGAAMIALGAVVATFTYGLTKQEVKQRLLIERTRQLQAEQRNLKMSYEALLPEMRAFNTEQAEAKYEEISSKISPLRAKLHNLGLEHDRLLKLQTMYEGEIIPSGGLKRTQAKLKQVSAQMQALKGIILQHTEARNFLRDTIIYNIDLEGKYESSLKSVNLKTGELISTLYKEQEARKLTNAQLVQQRFLMDAYALAAKEGINLGEEQYIQLIEQAKLLGQWVTKLDATSSSTRDWKSDLDSLRKSLDPTYAALRDKQDAMEIINKEVSKSDPLYRKLADAIEQRYTKAVQDATSASKEFATPMQTIRNELLGTQSAYDTYNQMVTKIINAQGDQVEKTRLVQLAYANLQDTLSNQMGIAEPPEVSGMIQKDPIEGERNTLDNWYKEQVKQDELRLELHEGYLSRKSELDAMYMERTNALNNAMVGSQLSTYSTLYGEMGALVGAFAGEQSLAYKALFAMQKGYAVASVIMSNAEALSKAWASAPFPFNLPAVAITAAKTGVLTSIVQNVAMPMAMAHDGIDSIPQTGTWLLEKGERVTTANTSAKLDRTLSRIEAGMGGEGVQTTSGKVSVNQTINVTGNVDNRTANQIASATARKQRLSEARFGR